MTPPDNLKARSGRKLTKEAIESYLALIAADITTETKVEFPKMAKLYWNDEDKPHPAHFVRASMSIPIFFHPYKLDVEPQGGIAREN